MVTALGGGYRQGTVNSVRHRGTQTTDRKRFPVNSSPSFARALWWALCRDFRRARHARTASAAPMGEASARDEWRVGPTRDDVAKPSIARVYDYVLGGKDNFAIDREVGDRLIAEA